MISNKRNKIKYLFLIITIGSLFLPKPSLAFIGTGVFDYFDAAMGGIEELSGPVAKMLLQVFIVYIIGVGALYTSAHLLQTVIEHPEWLSLSTNSMVQSGWAFISGLSNMFFILVFIIIALAIILKIESFQAKKVLPKLLLVALLVNFSLVFVGILVDVSNIFYKTILIEDNKGLPLKVIDSLGAGGNKVIFEIIAQVVLLAASFIIPIFSPFLQLGLTLLIVGVGFLPNILTWILQIICFFMMSGILFTYAFLFAARIYIVQLLAMLAPLAFLCSVLPQTQKYWDEWLKTIVEWIFLGIILFLFLVLGLRATDSLVPSHIRTIPMLPVFGWLSVPEYFIYYFFLFVYLTSTLWLSKKYMPELAEAMIKQGNIWGKMITRGITPIGKGIAISAKKTAEQWFAQQSAADAGKAPSRLQKMAKSKMPVFGRVVRGMGRTGLKAGAKAQARISKQKEDWTKQFARPEDALAFIGPEGQGLKDFSTDAERVSFGEYLAEQGTKYFQELPEARQRNITELANKISPKALDTILTKGNPDLVLKVEEIANKRREKIRKEEKEKVDERVKELIERRKKEGPESPLYGQTNTQLETKAVDQLVYEGVVSKIKPSEIKNYGKKQILGKEKLREAWVRTFGPEYWNQIGMNFDQPVMDEISKTANKMGPEFLAKVNPRSLKYWAAYGSDRWGWQKIKGAETKEDVEELIGKARIKKRGSERMAKAIYQKQEELEKLKKETKISPTELDKRVKTKVGTDVFKKKQQEFYNKILMDKGPPTPREKRDYEQEALSKTRSFLSEEFKKARKELEEEKSKNLKERMENLQKEIPSLKKEFSNAYMEERVMREKRLWKLKISEKEVDDRFRKIHEEARTIKPQETRKETYKLMDYLGIKKEKQEERFRDISWDLLRGKAEKQLIEEKEAVLKKMGPKGKLKEEISKLKEELKEKPTPSPEEIRKREKEKKEVKKEMEKDIKKAKKIRKKYKEERKKMEKK